ncbi:HNH endonuclease [Nocardioides aurantiacus]|nr:hypothetical protein [Nocardioides aurantiacus]
MPALRPAQQHPTFQFQHKARSPRWMGARGLYQRAALAKYASTTGRDVSIWAYVTTACDLDDCLDVECMFVHAPTHIDYPSRICVYCGDPSGTRDHLVPRAWSNGAARLFVAVVPACSDCNGRINDSWAVSVSERRKVAHASLRKKYRDLLTEKPWRQEDLDELGHALREHVIKGQHKREWVKARLAWPIDPEYDLRAFQRTGIEDPAERGLI